MNYFFTSDYHLEHANIIRLCNRPHANKDEMYEDILKKHNAVVKHNDTIYDLGDIFYRGDYKLLPEYLGSFNGRRIILSGNHDKDLKKCFKKGLLNKLINKNKLVILDPFRPNQNVIQSIWVNNQHIVLSHYALRSWPSSFRGSWNLFGHSHGNLEGFSKSMDVGVDTNDFRPYSFDEISQIISEKPDFFEKP